MRESSGLNEREMQDYIMHYGVLGMKWGVRKDRKTSGKSKKKRKKMTDKQKKYIKIGAAVAATALLAYGGYKLYKTGNADFLIGKGKDLVGGLLGSSNAVNKESIAKVVKSVNPLKGTVEGNMNCTFCSVASVLQLKGINATALGTDSGQSLFDVITTSFKNSHDALKAVSGSRVKSASDMAKILEKRFSDGTVGVVSIPTTSGKGHAFNWAIEKGKAIFFDSQLGLSDASSHFSLVDSSKFIDFARLDDLEIIEDGVKNFVKYSR